MELFTTLKRFIQEEHLWLSKVCTKKEAIDIDTKKPAGQLVSGSKESGITPITGFDAKLIDLFDYAKSAQSQYRGAIIYSR